jgi:hypothetical protein
MYLFLRHVVCCLRSVFLFLVYFVTSEESRAVLLLSLSKTFTRC